jgi:hypothetical protein
MGEKPGGLKERAMRGLYDGIEEVAFKPTAGGYVFQANNRWLFGPKQRFLVNEAQKAEIAACIRVTMKRIKPFVFASAVAIPLLLIAGIFAFVFTSGSLAVVEVSATGETASHTQWLHPNGATVVISDKSGAGATVRLSGLPGDAATATVTGKSTEGKPGGSTVVAFGQGGVTININDGDGRIARMAKLTASRGAPSDVTSLFAFVLFFALFAPYLAGLHVYGMRRLRPLLAGLPRTTERITVGEISARFATKSSNKLLILMGVAAAAAVVANATIFIDAYTSHRPLDVLPLVMGLGGGSISMIGFSYLMLLKFKSMRTAA